MRLRLAMMLLLAGCAHRGLVNTVALNKTKTVALVQLVENWGENKLGMGASMTPDSHEPTLVQTYDLFVQQFASRWSVMPRAALQAHPGYLRVGLREANGVFLPKGFRVVPGSAGPDAGMAKLPPESAAKMADALNVDAVVALSLSFAINVNDHGGYSVNRYRVNMYDRAGKLIWNDEVVGVSQLDEYLTVIYNPYVTSLADDPEKWTKQNASAFVDAAKKMQQHLEHPPEEYLPAP